MIEEWLSNRVQYGKGAQRRLVSENLKRCPLCSALNAKSNKECFVCTWHGEFEDDPDLIIEGLEKLLNRCPDLSGEIAPKRPKRNVLGFVRRLFHRRLDYRI